MRIRILKVEINSKSQFSKLQILRLGFRILEFVLVWDFHAACIYDADLREDGFTIQVWRENKAWM